MFLFSRLFASLPWNHSLKKKHLNNSLVGYFHRDIFFKISRSPPTQTSPDKLDFFVFLPTISRLLNVSRFLIVSFWSLFSFFLPWQQNLVSGKIYQKLFFFFLFFFLEMLLDFQKCCSTYFHTMSKIVIVVDLFFHRTWKHSIEL